jgi:hypothetical protein
MRLSFDIYLSMIFFRVPISNRYLGSFHKGQTEETQTRHDRNAVRSYSSLPVVSELRLPGQGQVPFELCNEWSHDDD